MAELKLRHPPGDQPWSALTCCHSGTASLGLVLARNEAVGRCWSQVHIPDRPNRAGPGSHGVSEAQVCGLGHNFRCHQEENCTKFKPIPKTTERAKQIKFKNMHYIVKRDKPSGFSVPTELCHKLRHLWGENSTFPNLKGLIQACHPPFLVSKNNVLLNGACFCTWTTLSSLSEETGPLAPLNSMDIKRWQNFIWKTIKSRGAYGAHHGSFGQIM